MTPKPDLQGEPPLRVGGLLLAAGMSSRMAEINKLLVPVGGTPMVRRAAEALIDGGADPVVCVIGHQAPEVSAALDGLSLGLVANPDFAQGMATSLVAGIRALEACPAVIVMLGDMPWVGGEVVGALTRAFVTHGPDAICVPTHEGRRGNPVLWPSRYFPPMMSLTGDEGARALIRRFADGVVEVPVPTDGILRDVDDAASLPLTPDSPSWPR